MQCAKDCCVYLTCRIEHLAEEDITNMANDHMILKPLNFSGHVTRLLSGWCKEIPAIDVGADLETLDVSVEMFNLQWNKHVCHCGLIPWPIHSV